MNKRSLLAVSLIVLLTLLVALTLPGCARPKPESKLTPTEPAGGVEAVATVFPLLTPANVEPTIVTTDPGTPAPEGTAAPAAVGDAATPTRVPLDVVTEPTEPATPASAASPEWTLYTIQWGDTLFSLASRFNTSVEEISALNGISRPDQIQTGMQIKVPQGGSTASGGTSGGGDAPSGSTTEYVVQAGDDLNGIARKFNVAVNAIVEVNNLKSADFIYVGQKLNIPSAGTTSSEEPAATGGKTHTVRAGESVVSIAAIYGTTSEAIAAENNLANPNWIYVGQVLRIP